MFNIWQLFDNWNLNTGTPSEEGKFSIFDSKPYKYTVNGNENNYKYNVKANDNDNGIAIDMELPVELNNNKLTNNNNNTNNNIFTDTDSPLSNSLTNLAVDSITSGSPKKLNPRALPLASSGLVLRRFTSINLLNSGLLGSIKSSTKSEVYGLKSYTTDSPNKDNTLPKNPTAGISTLDDSSSATPLKTYKDLDKKTSLKELNKKGGVYGFINLQTNQQYIGSSENINKRFRQHIKGSKSNERLKRSIAKYGLNNFIFVIYYYHDDPAVTLTEIETTIIKSFPFETLFNFKKEANSPLGYKHTAEPIE